ncbi:MAG: hypothetical protein DCC67_14420 [Planctomycetota bacterium]|nr:MAG: hypothetical protein DCC67_14420 [Planctomycetota bacterium]
MFTISHVHRIAVAVAASLAACGIGRAEDHAAVGPFIDNDVAAVAFVNLESINVPAVLEEIERLKLIPEDEIAAARQQAHAVQGVFGQLPAKGARRAYVLLRPQDVFHGGPTWLVETETPEQAAAVIECLKPMLADVRRSGDVANFLPEELRARGSMVIAAPANRMDKLATADAAVREDALAALAALDADAGVVYFHSPDTKRVLREMFPPLPAPFMEIDGQLLADGVKWAAFNIKLPPQPTIGASIETTAPEGAATLRGAFEKGAELAKAFLMSQMIGGPPAHRERAAQLLPLMPLLEAKVEGNRISYTFGDDEQEINFLASLLPALTQQLREDLYRDQRMNRFKQIALAMLNHESAKKCYPPAATYDAEGRPLLSWRVHVLPYLGHTALYQQFRLDEPWDSQHNRELVEQMPDVYADPDPSVRSAIGDRGRTAYVVPSGERTVFSGSDGMKIRDVIDGTSNTILVVEVVPERAVIWTKPEDWNVDFEHPLAGVQRTDRNGFLAAFADGHVQFFTNDVDPASFKAQLTADGNETVRQ